MTNAQKVTEYIRTHPRCTVTDVVNYFDTDAGTVWALLIDAERFGLITSDNSDGGTWHFAATAVTQ